MFTGIIEAIGQIAAIEHQGADKRFRIKTGTLDMADVKLGDSIAVNGVCLTATGLPGDGFWADVSAETLACATLAQMKVGAWVNLEKALLPTTRLGGHLVSGHVDGIGHILTKQADGRSIRFSIEAPADIAKYIATKGSITVNGISLTVNKVNGCIFELNIVPHTLANTTLAQAHSGEAVNLEVDVLARYLERLLQPNTDTPTKSAISMQFLAQNGFIR